MNWFRRPDDLVLFAMMFLLVLIMSLMGHWDLVNNLASAFVGACTMYIKGGHDGAGNVLIKEDSK